MIDRRKIFLILTLSFCIGYFANAQPNGGGGGGGGKPTPLTGIEYLIGLGGLLGVKKILSSRKKRKKE